MRILVIGKNGQLGRSIQNLVADTGQNDNFIFVGREELDLSNSNNIDHYFAINGKFDIVVNCAAYTAVDKAEEGQDLADQINHLAIKRVAEITAKTKTKLIHISTDYVFDGDSDKPYAELDQTNPINTYGKTKLAGEIAIQKVMPANAVIVRTSWVYSEYGNNFVKTILDLGKKKNEINVVNDQIGSPTYASDLAEVILTIISSNAYQEKECPTEIYHYSNDGRVSWYEFSKEIFRLADIECSVNHVRTEQYPTPAKRPKNTVMNKDKIIKVFGFEMRPWSQSLERCLSNFLKQDS